ncbi:MULTISPECIES: metal ABC transporter solute-binding protein, Zn/Mn family [unclassified Granulicatella]|uniref:metal ABC transporter solute-binding protein, Zn/Mn family n=1 Tax=unclassified Granulicatella TaxID=2630493 RepID=UPI001073FF9F|nr:MULTISPECIES: zinc ABC transporter substrate-binding protein [unclassified Granulicatella]MBF0779816.1 zinc ABC transporter substrate-binding protein [Granulicatella sp. 19428wC4_WM01]TFU96116.1 metal transporter [Granulicatella sp. WM01]
MKKILSLFTILFFLLAGCQNNATPTGQTSSKKTVTVTTSFLKDMAKQLAGDLIDTELIIPAGEDPHLYTAKASDLDKLKKADFVFYHGLHFEGKMVEVLEKTGVAVTKDFSKDDLGTFMQDEEEVVDPHFWFNIKLYKLATSTMSEELQKLLPEHKETIQQNTKKYLAQLDELDAWNKEQLSQIPEGSRYLVTPHDAFNYFAKSYNLTVHAPQGISTASEVANAAMIETANLIVDKKIKAIFSESTTNPERMQKLKEAVEAKGGQVTVVTGEGKELFSDSLAPAGEDGDTYIDMYKHNVSLIVKYLK